MTQYASPSSNIIRSLLQHTHSLSVYAEDMPYALKAEISELNLNTGNMSLEVEYGGSNIEKYLTSDGLIFDIETLKGSPTTERETYSLSNIPAKLHKTNSMLYRLDFQLPDTIFANDDEGTLRVPFILGMQARAHVEVYPHELNVPGRLRELSVNCCMVEVDLVDSIALDVGLEIPGITLEFPNGESFFAEGRVRHIRPFGNHGYAAVYFNFINLSSSQLQTLFHFVNEAEREASYRIGMSGKLIFKSPLFIPGHKELKMLKLAAIEREKRARHIPMESDVINVAHQLQAGLMYLKSRSQFSIDVFYGCADSILSLVRRDRKAFLYALSVLWNKPEWVRHAVQVAGKLADMLLLRNPHHPQVREAVLGALMHTMGKPLLMSASLPSLKLSMNPAQKEILRGHVQELIRKLPESGWMPGPVCRDVIENANERLDGTGYPAGKRGEQLSELSRLVSVIKAINKLEHARNDIPAHSPLEAYRQINEAGSAYEKAALIEYVQLYGPSPIGSLAKYAGGFLAWVMDTDSKGAPAKIHVIKDLRFPDSNISSVISQSDISQIGKLEKIVTPADSGVTPPVY
ncbi:HD domain-containing phosphohydrolase [Pantoea sp. FN0305]